MRFQELKPTSSDKWSRLVRPLVYIVYGGDQMRGEKVGGNCIGIIFANYISNLSTLPENNVTADNRVSM